MIWTRTQTAAQRDPAFAAHTVGPQITGPRWPTTMSPTSPNAVTLHASWPAGPAGDGADNQPNDQVPRSTWLTLLLRAQRDELLLHQEPDFPRPIFALAPELIEIRRRCVDFFRVICGSAQTIRTGFAAALALMPLRGASPSAPDARHRLQHRADRGGVVLGMAGPHRLVVDRHRGVEHRRRAPSWRANSPITAMSFCQTDTFMVGSS